MNGPALACVFAVIGLSIGGLLFHAAAVANKPAPKPERHHIYYCLYEGRFLHPTKPNTIIQMPLADYSFPCMYRKNIEIPV